MSRWRAEAAYLGRYIGAGTLNTLAGFAIIFSLTWLGVEPVPANIAGYAFGFLLGFFVSKKWVFASSGGMRSEGLRYLLAFLAAFLANLGTLHLALGISGMHPVVAQLLAAATYTVAMYVLSRIFVFTRLKS